MLGIEIHQRGDPFKLSARHSSSPVLMGHGAGSGGPGDRGAIGHGLTAHAGDAGGDLGGGIHEEVPQGTGDCDILGAERHADTPLGVVLLVDGVVAPVSAVSVGRCGDPSRRLGCCSRCCGRGSDFYFSRAHFNKGGETFAVLGPEFFASSGA
jgi:hypothetical protein